MGAGTGFEPIDHLAYETDGPPGLPAKNGGRDRNQTCDILLAKQTLYQLSYAPVKRKIVSRIYRHIDNLPFWFSKKNKNAT